MRYPWIITTIGLLAASAAQAQTETYVIDLDKAEGRIETLAVQPGQARLWTFLTEATGPLTLRIDRSVSPPTAEIETSAAAEDALTHSADFEAPEFGAWKYLGNLVIPATSAPLQERPAGFSATFRNLSVMLVSCPKPTTVVCVREVPPTGKDYDFKGSLAGSGTLRVSADTVFQEIRLSYEFDFLSEWEPGVSDDWEIFLSYDGPLPAPF